MQFSRRCFKGLHNKRLQRSDLIKKVILCCTGETHYVSKVLFVNAPVFFQFQCPSRYQIYIETM
jgi:hypothetical protein